VLLASLLTGARARGVELDAALVAASRGAATALGCSDEPARPGVRFVHGDACEADLDGADVYFLYVPFTGPVLREVLDRLAEATRGRRAHVCAAAIDTHRHPWLAAAGPSRSWLEVYRVR